MGKITCFIPSPAGAGEKENWLSSQLPSQTDSQGWTAASGRVGEHGTGTVQTGTRETAVILLCNHNKHLGIVEREDQQAFIGQTFIPVWQQCITAILSQALWVGMFTAESTEH